MVRPVYIVTGDFPPLLRGVGDYAFHLSRELATSGCETCVITTAISNAPREEWLQNVRILRVVHNWNISDAKLILQQIVRDRPVVNIQYNCPLAWGRRWMINVLPVLLRLSHPDARTVITMHGFWEQSALYRLRAAPMLRASHGVIFVDRRNRERLRLFAGRKKPMKFIPISGNIARVPTNEHIRRLCRNSIGIDDERTLVAFFGAIVPGKGFEGLIEAVEIARKRHRLPIHLVAIGGFIAGIHGSYQARMREIMSQEDRRSWIRVVQGPAPETVSALLNAADMGVFPFLRGVGENSGSVLAALQHGLPTIMTRGATAPPPHFAGIIVPAGDLEALSGQIVRLAKDAELRERLRDQALAFTRHLTWDRIARRTLDFFTSVASDQMTGAIDDRSDLAPML